MSSVASSRTTSTMSSTVTMPFMRPSASTTGMAMRSCSANRLGDRLLVHVLGHRDDVGAHHVAHRLVGRRGEELAERDHAEQSLLGVEHVDVVDRLERARAPAGAGRRSPRRRASRGAAARSAGSSDRRPRPRRRRAARSPPCASRSSSASRRSRSSSGASCTKSAASSGASRRIQSGARRAAARGAARPDRGPSGRGRDPRPRPARADGSPRRAPRPRAPARRRSSSAASSASSSASVGDTNAPSPAPFVSAHGPLPLTGSPACSVPPARPSRDRARAALPRCSDPSRAKPPAELRETRESSAQARRAAADFRHAGRPGSRVRRLTPPRARCR